MSYTPLPCDLYDYLEIACMANAQLRLALRSGETVIASPVTIRIVDSAEWLECTHSDSISRVRLDHILWFEPTRNKSLFERIVIPQNDG